MVDVDATDFFLVDIDQTEVYDRSTSWSTVDAVNARRRPFYWCFHHAQFLCKFNVFNNLPILSLLSIKTLHSQSLPNCML